MGICAKELRNLVIRPTLKHLGERKSNIPAAEALLLGTAAQESGLGFHLKEAHARGLGIYRITPRTHINVWDKFLVNQPEKASMIRGLASQHEFLINPHSELATNLSYATAIAWMIYQRANKPIPNGESVRELGEYWARHYHHKSLKTADEFVENYKTFVGDDGKPLAA